MYLSALLLCSGDLRTDLEILIPIKFLDLPQDESTVLQIVADYGCSAKIAARTAMRSHNYKSSLTVAVALDSRNSSIYRQHLKSPIFDNASDQAAAEVSRSLSR